MAKRETRRITEITVPGASLAELKALLRLPESAEGGSSEYPAQAGSDDTYLSGCLLTATQWAETYLNRAIIRGTFQVLSQDSRRKVYLPYPPFVEIISVLDVDAESLDYELDTRPEIPTIEVDSCDFAVRYTAGYGETYEAVPRQIQEGILRLAAYLFEHRGNCPMEDALSGSGAKMILRTKRVYPI